MTDEDDDNIRSSRSFLDQISETLNKESAKSDDENELWGKRDTITQPETREQSSNAVDTVAALWTPDLHVQDLTDTDLAQTRTINTKISDANRDVHRLVETLRLREELDNWSETADRALRVEVAAAIDNHNSLTRAEFNVKYTIPPVGWVSRQEFPRTDLVNPEAVDPDHRSVSFSTRPVVFDMAETAVSKDMYDSLTDVVLSGVDRMLGRHNTTSNNDITSHRETAIIPVIALCSSRSKRELLRFAITDMDTNAWYTTSEIAENLAASQSAIRAKFDEFVRYGILNLKSPDVSIPHYSVAETEPVKLLRTWEGYPILDLFGTPGRQELVRFFLTQADPEQSYSYNSITNKSEIGHQTVSNHMETLIDAELVESVEGTRSTEYQLATMSETYTFLLDLNKAIKKQLDR